MLTDGRMGGWMDKQDVVYTGAIVNRKGILETAITWMKLDVVFVEVN